MEVDFLNGTNGSRYFLPFDDEPHILDNAYVRAFLILLYTLIFVLCCFGKNLDIYAIFICSKVWIISR